MLLRVCLISTYYVLSSQLLRSIFFVFPLLSSLTLLSWYAKEGLAHLRHTGQLRTATRVLTHADVAGYDAYRTMRDMYISIYLYIHISCTCVRIHR